MENDKTSERVHALEKITIPRLNQETRDLIQDMIFEKSYQSIEFYDRFMFNVNMHKRERLDNPRFYKLLKDLVDEIKVYQKKNK